MEWLWSAATSGRGRRKRPGPFDTARLSDMSLRDAGGLFTGLSGCSADVRWRTKDWYGGFAGHDERGRYAVQPALISADTALKSASWQVRNHSKATISVETMTAPAWCRRAIARP